MAKPVADREQVEERLAQCHDEEGWGVALPALEIAPPDPKGPYRRQHAQSRRAWPVSRRKTSSSVARRWVNSRSASSANAAASACPSRM